MTISLRMLLTADGKQAKAEVKGVATEVTKAGAATDGLSGKATKATAATNSLGRASASTANQVQLLSGAEARLAAASGRLTAANGLAAGSVGNLAAQFNDILVMLAAGQNPFQLAIQQGTQITQVIGPLGATGAVRALSTAFLSLINPVSLITLGTIAGGAALFQLTQRLLGAGDEAKTFAERTEEAADAIDALRTANELSVASLSDLNAEFGASTEALRTALDVLAALSLSTAVGQVRSLNDEIADLLQTAGAGESRANLADFFDVNIFLAFTDKQRAAREEARLLTFEFQQQQQALGAAGSDLDAQSIALRGLLDVAQRLADASGERSSEEEELIGKIAKALAVTERLRGETDRVVASAAEIAAGYRSVAAAQTTLTQATDAYIAKMADAFNEAENLREEIGVAAAEALRLAGVDITSPISSAATQAAILAGNLGIALSDAISLQNLQSSLQYSGRGQNPNRFGNPFERDGTESSGQISPGAQALIDAAERRNRSRRRGGGRGRASEAQREAEAVQNLVDRLQNQLDVLRETDPVQKEMIRNRETLANASEAERVKIQDLITQHREETLALERKRATWDLLNSTASGILDGLFDKTKSFGDVLKDTLATLLEVYAQGQLLGTGPFGDGNGGLLGALFPALVPTRANGGMIYGPGGPRDDKVLTLMSNGEMAINARATARHRPLLEMINAGAPIPRLASGGYVGRPANSSFGPDGGQILQLKATVNVKGAMGNKEIEEFARRGTEQAIQDFSREVLPDRVATIQSEPRMVG